MMRSPTSAISVLLPRVMDTTFGNVNSAVAPSMTGVAFTSVDRSSIMRVTIVESPESD